MWTSERFLWLLCSSICSAVLQFRHSLKGFVSPTLCGAAAESPASSRCEVPSSLSPQAELTASVPVPGTMAPAQRHQARAAGGTAVSIAPKPVAPREGATGQGVLSTPIPSILLQQQALLPPSPVLALSHHSRPYPGPASLKALSECFSSPDSRKGT